MRIQETDRVLKDARFARRANAREDETGMTMRSSIWIAAAVAVAAILGGLIAYFVRRD